MKLTKESPLAEDLTRAQYHLLEQVPGADPALWATDDEPVEEVDVGEPTDAEERVAEILPKLFVEESEADRKELLSELADIAAHNPQTIRGMSFGVVGAKSVDFETEGTPVSVRDGHSDESQSEDTTTSTTGSGFTAFGGVMGLLLAALLFGRREGSSLIQVVTPAQFGLPSSIRS